MHNILLISCLVTIALFWLLNYSFCNFWALNIPNIYEKIYRLTGTNSLNAMESHSLIHTCTLHGGLVIAPVTGIQCCNVLFTWYVLEIFQRVLHLTLKKAWHVEKLEGCMNAYRTFCITQWMAMLQFNLPLKNNGKKFKQLFICKNLNTETKGSSSEHFCFHIFACFFLVSDIVEQISLNPIYIKDIKGKKKTFRILVKEIKTESISLQFY